VNAVFKKTIGVLSGTFMLVTFAGPSLLDQDIAAFSDAHVGVVVMDPTHGQILYQYQANQYFHPASTVKLFTAIAAYLNLGPDYQFSTLLKTYNGNMYIDFSGDPSLTQQDLNSLLAELPKMGIKKIKGNVILDDHLFPADAYALGVPHETNMWNYGASARGVMLDENAITVTFRANTPIPEILSVMPKGVTVHTQGLVWQDKDNTAICTFRALPAPGNVLNLSGCLPPASTTVSLSIPDPMGYAQTQVKADLAALGIQLQGKVIQGITPTGATMILADHHSAVLTTLMTTMLQNSDNLYASALAETLGLKRYGLGTEKAGVAAIMAILEPYELPEYNLENGAGTSYANLVTPLDMAKLLIQALPVQGDFHAKSGTLSNTSAQAGFLVMKNGRPLIVIMMVGDTLIPTAERTAFEAKMISDLLSSPANR
jgi:serine-type D-Ala-D-Ala carboxypeptidase/endopeptidase (penicillin-binding protein 4)